MHRSAPPGARRPAAGVPTGSLTTVSQRVARTSAE